MGACYCSTVPPPETPKDDEGAFKSYLTTKDTKNPNTAFSFTTKTTEILNKPLIKNGKPDGINPNNKSSPNTARTKTVANNSQEVAENVDWTDDSYHKPQIECEHNLSEESSIQSDDNRQCSKNNFNSHITQTTKKPQKGTWLETTRNEKKKDMNTEQEKVTLLPKNNNNNNNTMKTHLNNDKSQVNKKNPRYDNTKNG